MDIQAELPTQKMPRIDEIAHKAREVKDSQPFMEPGEAVKKKRGRPPGSGKGKTDNVGNPSQTRESSQASGPQAQSIPTAELVKPLLGLVSTAAAAYVEDERARMKPEELDGGAAALGMLLDKWMPNMISVWGPEIMCAMIFGQYGIRVYALKRIKVLEEIEERMRKESAQPTEEPKVGVPDALKV